MKKLVLVIMLLLIGCAPVEQPETDKVTSPTGITYGVNRIEDKEAGVVCWIYANGYQGGISCLPIGETLLKESGG